MINPTFRVTTHAALTSGDDVSELVVRAQGSVPHNGEGRKRLTIPHGETLTASPLDDGVVQVLFDGTVADAMLLEGQTTVEVAEGEESEMPTVFDGRGLAGLLDRYRFRPQLGYDREPYSDKVTFSAFHPSYADHLASPWDDAIQIAVVGEDSARYTGLPNGYPHFQGIWIGPPGTDDLEAPAGYWWWLHDLALEDDLVLAFFTAGDNRYDFYIGGLRVATVEETRETRSPFAETHLTIVSLSAGTHRLGAKVTNLNPDLSVHGYGEGATVTGNPTAFTAVAFVVDGRGALGEIIWETSTDARVLAFPTDPPGMTMPEILQVVIDESVTDGADPEFTLIDTGSFAELETVTVDRKDSALKVLRDDWAEIYCDWTVPPDALELHIWPPQERGDPSGVVYDTDTDPTVANVMRLESAIVDDGTDYLIVDWLGGPPFRHPSSGGTRPGSLSTKATSRREAEMVAARVLSTPAQPEQISVRVAPVGGDVPGVDLDNGDTCDVAAHAEQRLLEWSWQVSDDLAGEPQFGIVVNHVIPTDDSRLGKRLRALSGGDSGTVAPASAVLPQLPFGSKINSSDVTFHPIGAIVTGPCDKEKRPVTSGNMFAVAVTAETAGSTDTEFEFWVNDVDVLDGAGVLPSGELFALIPTDGVGSGLGTGPTVYVLGNATRMRPNITAVGTGVAGLVFEPRFL